MIVDLPKGPPNGIDGGSREAGEGDDEYDTTRKLDRLECYTSLCPWDRMEDTVD